MAGASCPPTYDWAKNSLHMDPCAVASKLIQACGTGPGLLKLDPPHTPYAPPTKKTQTICTCSGPVYVLVSACADCQGGKIDLWHIWFQQCPNTSGMFLHNPMIPTWAERFIDNNLTYDPISAQALASLAHPQSTSAITSTPVAISITSTAPSSAAPPSAAPSSSKPDTAASSSSLSDPLSNIPHGDDISTTASQATATLGANQVTDQANSGSLKKSSNTGAIAGGVVGGLIFLVAIGAFLLWWLQRRRRLRTAPSAAYIAAYGMARSPTSNSFQPGPFDERAGSPLVSHAYSNSRAEKYQDDEKSTSTYSGGPLQ